MTTQIDILNDITEHFGTQRELARCLGITPGAISLWRTDGKIPPSAALDIEILTCGKFTALAIHKAGIKQERLDHLVLNRLI